VIFEFIETLKKQGIKMIAYSSLGLASAKSIDVRSVTLNPYVDINRKLEAARLEIFESKKSRKKCQAIQEIDRDLRELESVWADVEMTRDRNAVLEYLQAVFRAVKRWDQQNRVKTLVRRAQAFAGIAADSNSDLFAIVIQATADNVAAKTRSKWSRALRFVAAYRRGKPFMKFMIKHGGISGCATAFARRLGRGKSRSE
jgi:hypothetical protein